LEPKLFPLTFHWKRGVVPPLVGVAVKVMGTPWHWELKLEVMLTLTGSPEPATMVIEFDVAGFPVIQLLFEVMMHDMTSPTAGVYV
jgi:hypothetical protein